MVIIDRRSDDNITKDISFETILTNLLPLCDPTLLRTGEGYESIKITGSAVIYHFPIVLHSKIFVTVITSVELELIERLTTNQMKTIRVKNI